MRILKICLRQLFSYPKWVLQAILSLTVFLADQTLIPFFYVIVPNFVVFFRLLDRKFNEDSKNGLKTVILSLCGLLPS